MTLANSEIEQWRVKLYKLDKEGHWIDKGTGFVSCQHPHEANEHLADITNDSSYYLVVACESSNNLLLRSPINLNDVYERQGESVIMWKELCEVEGCEVDYALSFQETGGFYALWQSILEIQQSFSRERSQSLISEDFAVTLPSIAVENIDTVQLCLAQCPLAHKNNYAQVMLEEDCAYVKEIIKLYEHNKDNIMLLQKLADIVRKIFYLNNLKLVELLLDDDLYLSLASIMQYDPMLNSPADYVTYLSTPQHAEPVSYSDLNLTTSSAMRGAIGKLLRAKYFKDIILRPVIDETGIGAVNALINNLQVDIAAWLFPDAAYMQKLLSLIDKQMSNIISIASDANSTMNGGSFIHANSGLIFLRELFAISRQLTLPRRIEMYTALLESCPQALFSVLLLILSHRSPATTSHRLIAAEILSLLVSACPQFLRQSIVEGPTPTLPSYCTTTKPARAFSPVKVNNDLCMLYVLIERLTNDTDTAIIEHMGDIIKALVDPDRLEALERERFLALFYDYYVQWLMVPFIESHEDGTLLGKPASSVSAVSSSVRYICEIMSLGVVGHSYRMRYFIMRYNVIAKLLEIVNSVKHSHIILSPLKLLRTIVLTKDEFYNKHITKFELFRYMFDYYATIADRDNILTSVVIEICAFVFNENVNTLLLHMVDKHRTIFETVMKHEIASKLLSRYDQLMHKETVTAPSFKYFDYNQAAEDSYFEEDHHCDKKAKCNGTSLSLLSEYENDMEDTDMTDDADPPLPPLRAKFEPDETPSAFISTSKVPKVATKQLKFILKSDLAKENESDLFLSDDSQESRSRRHNNSPVA